MKEGDWGGGRGESVCVCERVRERERVGGTEEGTEKESESECVSLVAGGCGVVGVG